MLTLPRISGHRGSLDTDPENTIRSFRAAVAAGAALVELDLHRSADGELVVMHDATVDRTTDGTGRVNDLDLAAIKTLRAGGEEVPTFPEVLEAIEAPIQVEVKDPAAVEPLVALLRPRPELSERLTLSSFSASTVRELAAALPKFGRGLITSSYDDGLADRCQALGCRVAYVGWENLTAGAVAGLQATGLDVTVWMVHTREQLENAIALGVDEISSNHTAQAMRWLRELSG
ncbi:glycerophosphodiester phosphodiesterase [Pseudactinotalea terrae]|uniref:glycerophosphodiester phosphodiesterase n=1 Tax=Pseudactinotalea terrae TaxID=1743262 RepID=UPI0012E276CA|nr:glycerophosphodiester phosphodiesterase family protein [Pseudactinotalea terrae]